MSDAKLRELPPRFWLTCPNCDNTGECHCDENGCAPHSSSYLEPPDDYFECDDCGGTRVCKVCKGAGVVPLSDEEAREMLAAEPEPKHNHATIRWMCDVIESYAEDRAWNTAEGEATPDGEAQYLGVVSLDEVREFARAFGTSKWSDVVEEKGLDPDCYLAEPEPSILDRFRVTIDPGIPEGLVMVQPESGATIIMRAPEPDPAPSVVTGPQLKAGLGAFLNVFLNGAKPDTIPQMWVTAVNAALEAAERIRTGGQG